MNLVWKLVAFVHAIAALDPESKQPVLQQDLKRVLPNTIALEPSPREKRARENRQISLKNAVAEKPKLEAKASKQLTTSEEVKLPTPTVDPLELSMTASSAVKKASEAFTEGKQHLAAAEASAKEAERLRVQWLEQRKKYLENTDEAQLGLLEKLAAEAEDLMNSAILEAETSHVAGMESAKTFDWAFTTAITARDQLQGILDEGGAPCDKEELDEVTESLDHTTSQLGLLNIQRNQLKEQGEALYKKINLLKASADSQSDLTT